MQHRCKARDERPRRYWYIFCIRVEHAPSMLRADSDAKFLCSGWCKKKPKKRPLENLPQPNNFASKKFIDAKKFRRRAKIIDTNFASVHGHSKNTDAALMQKIFFASPCTDACITTLHRCWTGACIDAALMHASVSSIFLGGSNKIFSLWCPLGCREVGKRIKDWKSRGSTEAPAYVKGVVRPRC